MNQPLRSSLLLTLAFLPALVSARPLLTRPEETVGRYAFESQFSIFGRRDVFNSPKSTYRSVGIPVAARLGITPRFDFGFTLDSYTQTLESSGDEISGSRNGLISPEVKYALFDDVSLLGIWHMRSPEISDQTLPVARGDDFEFMALAKIPTAWPITFNGGYLYRNPYHSEKGTENAVKVKFEPGNIWEARSALEVPLPAHFVGLGEMAYYHVTSETIGGEHIQSSKGDAADALIGLSWDYKAWSLGTGVAFGLLNERHTSFDLERGAGDVTYRFSAVYKLYARKPGS